MTRLSTGIDGLDQVLLGGFLAGRVSMVRGQPGAGKTTLGMQFLLEGVARGETVLFVTLSESEDELRANGESHGWDLAGVNFLDIHPMAAGDSADSQYTIFHPSEVELVPVARRIQEELDRLNPTRVVFDSLTQVRLLSRDQLRYRRQILALKSDLLRRGTTTLFLADRGQEQLDSEIASIVQGVISLTLKKGREGLTRRFIEVEKCRGSAYCEGEHPLRIGRGGLEVFPRLLSREHERSFERASVSSSVEGFDAMLGGGLDRGTCTLIIGNTGVGKTTLGMAIVAAAVGRGESAAVYTFDEGTAEMVYRSEAVGLKIRPAIDSGLLRIRKVNPLLLYPDEFAAWVRVEVEQRGVKVIMIDSLNGYNQSMPDENYLAGHMHQLIGYLNQMGVVTILVNEVSDLIGGFSATRFGLSYMADTVVFIHYYEFAGAMHKAIGVLKKRLSNHDKALRAYHLGEGQISVGKLLPDLHGILRGEPSRNYILPEGGSQLG